MLDAGPENIGAMAGFLRAKAHEALVALDNNIIPYLDGRQFRETDLEILRKIVEFNLGLARLVRDFSFERVIIAKDIRGEMDSSLSRMASREMPGEIGGPHRRQVVNELLESYRFIHSEVKKRSDDYRLDDAVYESLRDIVRKLTLDFPGLKKDAVVGKKEADEKMVAYAFARVMSECRKLYIFSDDIDVVRLSSQLYHVLTAENMGGGGATVAERRLRESNIEVIGYDPRFRLFKTKFNGRADFPEGSHWEPPESAEYSLRDIDGLREFVLERIALAAKALEARGAPPAKSDAGIPADPVRAAIERISDRLRIVPSDLDGAPESRIEEAVRSYDDLVFVHERLGVPASGLEEELELIRAKSLKSIVGRLDKENEELAEAISEITRDPGHFKSKEKREEVKRLYEKIDGNILKKESLSKGAEGGGARGAPGDLSSDERGVYEACKEQGFDLAGENASVPAEAISRVTGWHPTYVSKVLNEMKRDENVRLVRTRVGKKIFNEIRLRHLSWFSPKKKRKSTPTPDAHDSE
jgi:hypothetical protein